MSREELTQIPEKVLRRRSSATVFLIIGAMLVPSIFFMATNPTVVENIIENVFNIRLDKKLTNLSVSINSDFNLKYKEITSTYVTSGCGNIDPFEEVSWIQPMGYILYEDRPNVIRQINYNLYGYSYVSKAYVGLNAEYNGEFNFQLCSESGGVETYYYSEILDTANLDVVNQTTKFGRTWNIYEINTNCAIDKNKYTYVQVSKNNNVEMEIFGFSSATCVAYKNYTGTFLPLQLNMWSWFNIYTLFKVDEIIDRKYPTNMTHFDMYFSQEDKIVVKYWNLLGESLTGKTNNFNMNVAYKNFSLIGIGMYLDSTDLNNLPHQNMQFSLNAPTKQFMLRNINIMYDFVFGNYNIVMKDIILNKTNGYRLNVTTFTLYKYNEDQAYFDLTIKNSDTTFDVSNHEKDITTEDIYYKVISRLEFTGIRHEINYFAVMNPDGNTFVFTYVSEWAPEQWAGTSNSFVMYIPNPKPFKFTISTESGYWLYDQLVPLNNFPNVDQYWIYFDGYNEDATTIQISGYVVYGINGIPYNEPFVFNYIK